MSDQPSGLQALLDELRRRRVVRVAIVYVAVGLALLQAFDLVLPALGAPESLFGVIVRALIVGLPVALMLSWRYDITPHGLVQTTGSDEVAEGSAVRWLSGPSLVVVASAGLALAAGWAWGRGPVPAAPVDDSPAPGVRAIAVLPLENLSPDPDDAYFSEGLTDEIRHALGRIDGVRTAARSSAFAMAGESSDVRDVGRRLGVDAVLTGSVRRSGDDVRITVSLGDAADGLELWADSYDAATTDVFTVQSRIARRIAQALDTRLSDDAADAIAAPPTESAMALDKYRWGRFNWNRRTEEGIRAAITNFEEALEFDPQFAHAWSGLADAWVLLPEYASGVDPATALSRADSAAARALELDPDLPSARASLGLVRMLAWDWDAAQRAFETAIDADPDYATAHQWLANLLMGIGRLDEALESAREARRLDPLSSVARQDEARVLTAMGRRAEAIDSLQATLAADPAYAPAWYDIGWAFLLDDRFDDARNAFSAADERALADPAPLRALVDAVERRHRSGEPQPLPRSLESLAEVQPVLVAAAELELGRTDDALSRLERALERRAWDLIAIGANPVFGSLVDEPRYRAIVRAVGVEGWLDRDR